MEEVRSSVYTYLRIQCRGTRHLDFVLFCTSSFMGGKGTYFNDSLVVKASGGQTLTIVYIYNGSLLVLLPLRPSRLADSWSDLWLEPTRATPEPGRRACG